MANVGLSRLTPNLNRETGAAIRTRERRSLFFVGIVVVARRLALVDYDREWHDLRAQVEGAVAADDA